MTHINASCGRAPDACMAVPCQLRCRSEGCVPNPDKAAQQAKHPMPETKGMKGMDPKAHTVDCPAGYVPRETPAHVHK